jgi:hypothetical protein
MQDGTELTALNKVAPVSKLTSQITFIFPKGETFSSFLFMGYQSRLTCSLCIKADCFDCCGCNS